ncbi:hypothetical protein DFH27DRAFT_511334 [Peziza echinospora]|nr:hypothetical protein DFH27DRAFT_511334 [Peziza echinospora]
MPDSIIIAIDFGTTSSGVAWVSRARLLLLSEWKSQVLKTDSKVPTTLAYNTKEVKNNNAGRAAQLPKWGFDIPQNAKWQRVEWFKLLLNENCTTTAELLEKVETAIPEGKSPVYLATDYLKALSEHAKKRLEISYPELKEVFAGRGTPLIFYLTVPAIWDDRTKDLTMQAELGAGLGDGGAQIHMISEPEAAAVHCLKDMRLTKDSIKVDDIFVVTDGGGGTVDLISYQITAVDPLKVKECTIGSSSLCGSTTINRRFEALVRDRMGQERDFERLKCDYTILPEDELQYEDDSENDIICKLFGADDQEEKEIFHQELRLKQKEMQGLFHPTFEQIKSLAQQQVTEAEKLCKKSAVLLVGGSRNSIYLKEWLERNIISQDGQPVKCLKPENPALAIVLGAVEHGVAMYRAGDISGTSPCVGSMVQSRRARFHYGISLSEDFDPKKHSRKKRQFNPLNGEFMCTGRMSWLVKKGEELRTGDPPKNGVYSFSTCHPTSGRLDSRRQHLFQQCACAT